jgi:DNA-binding LytR/AlgR family response regulator
MSAGTLAWSTKPRRLLLGSWAVVAVVGGALRWLDRSLSGARNDVTAVALDLWLVALWVGATPLIVRSVRRYPIRQGAMLRHAALHCAFAAAFILGTNVLIRVPMSFRFGASAAALNLLAGLARFAPTAFIAYGVIVAIGHWSLGRVESAPAPAAERPERIAVREWSRVRLVRPADIDWIEADDNYVVVQAAGRTYKGRGRISELASQLDPTAFARVRRSAVVRLASVREVQTLAKGDLALVLDGGKVFRVARGRRAALEAALQAALGARI